MEDVVQVIVRNEADAFKVIERALKRELGDRPVELKFDNWPIVEIKLEGKGYDSTITPDIAAALVELQHAMNRAYARAVHDSTNARKLTAEERRELQFKAKVEKGSSLIKVDLGEYAEKMALALVDKMGPEHLVATVVGVAIVGGSLLAYKAFLKHRTEDKKIEEDTRRAIELSQEETRRLEVFANAQKAYPQLGLAKEDFDVARNEIVRGTGDAKSIEVNSVKLDRESARTIATAKRSESRDVQLNGTYEILRVDWQQEDEVRLKVSNVDTKLEFMASFKDQSIRQEQIGLLKDAEWSRSKVYLSINATELRGEITTATIVAITQQPPA